MYENKDRLKIFTFEAVFCFTLSVTVSSRYRTHSRNTLYNARITGLRAVDRNKCLVFVTVQNLLFFPDIIRDRNH